MLALDGAQGETSGTTENICMGGESVIFTKDGRVNTKIKRIQRYRDDNEESSFPASYTSNSTQEELCLEYVGSFVDQFSSVYPKRNRPFVTAENECGVQKFVCTTVRPTLLPFPELYDYIECASFLAGFIHYEPLDPPEAPPPILASPNLTLKHHIGDSFDMAILLCSFLIGAGYDAYVVNGYAPRTVTLRDTANNPIPVNISSADTSSSKNSFKPQQGVVEEEKNPYQPINNTVRTSSFLVGEAERKRLEGLDTFVLWIPQGESAEKSNDVTSAAQDDDSKRAHAWVMIAAGRRDIKQNLFIEATTGRSYSTLSSPYTHIESMWNHKNYWVNLAYDSKIEEIDFDLTNTSVWEYMFMADSEESVEGQEGQGGEEDGLLKDETGPETEESPITHEVTFDCPPVWSLPIELDRQAYLIRYPPTGRRTVYYRKSKVDFFARNMQPQSMVMRVTVYHDTERIMVQEIHEWFENRKDKMYKRIRFYLGGRRFIEYYHPGSLGEVKQWLEYPGKRRDVQFYIDGRLDRMYRREEIIGEKVSEYYEGRTDYMTYRSFLFTPDESLAGSRRQFSLPGGGLAEQLFVLKMITVFDRNPAIKSSDDVAKRVYFITEGKLTSQYHFTPGKITCTTKVLNHLRQGGGGHTEDELNEEDLEVLHEAGILERDTFAQVKETFRQMSLIVKFREETEKNPVNEPTIFEIALNKSEAKERDVDDAETTVSTADAFGADYLTPFLRNVKDTSKMTREEAMDIRQTCLDSLKARLVERANIIQSRLNEENNKLARKQEQFQRAQRDGEISGEDYEKYCTEAMFRISILEKRLIEHEESALKKFAELDNKLAQDPRLKVLKGAHTL